MHMLGQERGFEWVKENIKQCPISNSMDLIGKKFAVLILAT
jgi:DNA-binding HxlR family transcriptional regulator